MSANDTRPKNCLRRSMLDSESLDDRAPVRSRLALSSSPGEKSRLGTMDEPGIGFGASTGSVGSAVEGGGGGGGAGEDFAGPVAAFALGFRGGGGGLEAMHRTDWYAKLRAAGDLNAAWSMFFENDAGERRGSSGSRVWLHCKSARQAVTIFGR